jgi:hypothetical protein
MQKVEQRKIQEHPLRKKESREKNGLHSIRNDSSWMHEQLSGGRKHYTTPTKGNIRSGRDPLEANLENPMVKRRGKKYILLASNHGSKKIQQ